MFQAVCCAFKVEWGWFPIFFWPMSIAYSNTENNKNANMNCLKRLKGEGGSFIQLNNLSVTIEGQPRAMNKSTQDIPLTQGVNPIAPQNRKPRWGCPSKVCQPYYLMHFPLLTFTQPNPTVPIPASIPPPFALMHILLPVSGCHFHDQSIFLQD